MKTSTHLDLSLSRLPASTAFCSPNAPPSQEDNWVQTMPAKGWNTNFAGLRAATLVRQEVEAGRF
jgi:hypothetical protein